MLRKKKAATATLRVEGVKSNPLLQRNPFEHDFPIQRTKLCERENSFQLFIKAIRYVEPKCNERGKRRIGISIRGMKYVPTHSARASAKFITGEDAKCSVMVKLKASLNLLNQQMRRRGKKVFKASDGAEKRETKRRLRKGRESLRNCASGFSINLSLRLGNTARRQFDSLLVITRVKLSSAVSSFSARLKCHKNMSFSCLFLRISAGGRRGKGFQIEIAVLRALGFMFRIGSPNKYFSIKHIADVFMLINRSQTFGRGEAFLRRLLMLELF